MRTTLDIDPDVLQAARALAQTQNISLGAAVSQLARRGLERERSDAAQDLPRFKVPTGARRFGLDDVKRLEDEA